jgi:antitoxin component of MazEF toxin-antitoxin module
MQLRVTIKAKRVGGSIMVRLPKEVVDKEGIHEGELVEVEVTKARKSWFGIDPGIGPMTREDELDARF